MDLLGTSAFNKLELSLDAAALRQKVIAHNIANVDTPNFKRSEVRFEEFLQKETRALQKPTFSAYLTHRKHIPIHTKAEEPIRPEVVVDRQTIMTNNNNNVDIEAEMALMAKNQLYYNMLVEQVNYQIKHLRTAIGGRF